ncbi:hypothetical protein PVAND_005201 [Polypedilum vanderplanki]|uniref:Protein FAM98A n=1 Tax=Polypedilum vanderplanki TaxID=319348 RepID=A0A9J6BZ79_POLVA|nr:hypothetical protein PVAND_005201 [Polypedilum vanderplanki]
MSYEIVESLINVGYDGRLIDENAFGEAISEGFKNEDFRNLVLWLTNEIAELGKLEERITCLEVSSFLIELSGFLKELQCNYDILVGDRNINNRMQTVESRYILLEFFIAELMTQKMLLVKQKPKDKGNIITIHESPTAAALKDIAITLNLGKPPDNISADALFAKINTRFDETMKSIPKSEQRIGNPLFNPKNALTNEQWIKVEKIQAALEQEYNMRRKMLMTRLDVTIQSFKWSDKIKGKEKDINEKFSNKQQLLEKVNQDHRTDIVALLAARDKLAIIEKTSSANVRKNTKSKLQRHIIGKVPDRGGRTLELQKPPPEMPSWQKRNDGGGRGGGRGGGNFNQNRGNFNQSNRGHHQKQGQGFPQEQYQSRPQHRPSNHQQNSGDYQFYGNQQQQNYNDNNQGYSGNSRGGRVQGGWNNRGQSYDNNYRGGRGGRR